VIPLFAHANEDGLVSWEPHPEVWLLVAGVLVLGVYVAKVIGPKVVPEGERPVTRRQVYWFFTGVVLLWLASDWPIHDIGENSLYTAHMVQHLLLTLLVPPAFWLATPEWLARLVIRDDRRSYSVLKRVAHPLVAFIIFNTTTVFIHWPAVVNTSVRVGAFHYTMHVLIVTTAFIMWIPVCGPWKELRLSPPGQMIYLFMNSVIPTIPGAWLSLASAPVYEVYDTGHQLFGMTVLEDQATAGVFMKLVGGIFLWSVILVIFCRWAINLERENKRNRLVVDPVTMQPVTLDEAGDPDDPPAVGIGRSTRTGAAT